MSIESSRPMSASLLIDLIKNRRSYYGLSKDMTVSKDRIQEIVKEALVQVPSSYNSQSNRVVVLFDEDHDKLWDITTEVLKAVVPEDRWEPTGQKMKRFRDAAGTVGLPSCCRVIALNTQT
jgi:uncharacterized protein